jgi:hypothetical protein
VFLPLDETLTHQTSGYIGPSASRLADDDPYGPRWIGLRPYDARHDRKRGSARCQVQEIVYGKFHDAPRSDGYGARRHAGAVGIHKPNVG